MGLYMRSFVSETIRHRPEEKNQSFYIIMTKSYAQDNHCVG